MVFFSADHHFGHKAIIEFCNRKFWTLEEMEASMIMKWNAVVGYKDVVYVLGDFAFRCKPEYTLNIIAKLNGAKVFIPGSHDKWIKRAIRDNLILQKHRTTIGEKIEKISVDGQKIVLCHYSMRSWPGSCSGSWMLFAHSHSRLKPYGKSFDVGVDCWNFTPVSFAEVVEKMKTLENNYD